jgi:hypothetical protein
LRNTHPIPLLRCNGKHQTRSMNMNWLPEGLDKLDKRAALFTVASAALVFMFTKTLEKL